MKKKTTTPEQLCRDAIARDQRVELSTRKGKIGKCHGKWNMCVGVCVTDAVPELACHDIELICLFAIMQQNVGKKHEHI